MSRREASSEIDEAAADWALRIDEAVLDDRERAAFDAWVRGDARRAGAFARAQAVLIHVKRAKALGSEFEPASFVRDAGADPAADEMPGRAGFTRRGMLAGGSAAAAAAALAFVLPAGRASARVYETGRGETRLVPLEDGSTVMLNTDSRIAATIDRAQRTVRLLRGEALFKVAAGGRAPFLVDAGEASLRARNATFSVCRLDAWPVRVQVCDGDVEVARGRFAAPGARILHANMQAVVSPRGAIVESRVAPEALQRELAWQEGMLSFEDTPLSEAAREFARYSDRRIEITDPMVRSETVTGLYAANNPEGFARAVALGLNLRVRKTREGVMLTR